MAATLVVVYHVDLQLFRLSNGQVVQSGFGAAGTDLLFVICGFILVYITRERGRFGEFMFRRVARVAPLYWVLTVCMLVAFLVSPHLFHSTAFDVRHFVASLAFLPHIHPVLGTQRPLLAAGWALNAIVFFYFLFGLFLFLSRTRRIMVVGLILCALVALRFAFFGYNRFLDFYGAPVMLDFVLGMIVAWIYLGRYSAPVTVVALVLLVSAAIFATGVWRGAGGGDERVLYWGLSDTGLLLSLLFIERQWGWWAPSVFVQLGDASFSTYLSNLFTLAVGAKAIQLTGLFPLLGTMGTKILLVVGSLVVGVLLSIVVERPLYTFALRKGDLWLKKSPPALVRA